MRKIILASNSPRRKEILAKTRLKFEIVESNYEEDMTLKLKPRELAKFLSKEKAQIVAKKSKNSILISADTFIVLKNKILGKPHTKEKATKMLMEINDQKLRIITGYTIIDQATNKVISESKETQIKIKKLGRQEIENYVQTGESLDKAGAFAIQGLGSILIEEMKGDFFNALGLPIFDIANHLKKIGIKIL